MAHVEDEISRQGDPEPENYISCRGYCQHAKKNVEDFRLHLATWGLWTPELVKTRSLANIYLNFRHGEVEDHRPKHERQECALYCTVLRARSFKFACNELFRKSSENEKVLDDELKFDSTIEDGDMKGFHTPVPPQIVDDKVHKHGRTLTPTFLTNAAFEDAMQIDE